MHFVPEPRAMPHDLIAPGHQPAFAFVAASGVQICGRYGRLQTGQRAASILSVFTCAWAIAFTCSGLAIITRATNGASTRDTAMLLAVASITTSSLASSLLPNPSNAVRVIPTRPSSVLPKHHLPESSLDIDPYHSSHSPLLPDT